MLCLAELLIVRSENDRDAIHGCFEYIVNTRTETTTDVIRFKAEELCIPENVTVKGEGQAKRLSADRMELTIPADSLLALEWEV